MRKSFLVAVLMIMVAAFGAWAVVAQESTPEAPLGGDGLTPTAEPGMEGDADGAGIDLEGLTAETDQYYGQTVRLEGVITNLVNVRAFVLGEGAVLDDDQVLVVNMSGEELDIRLTDGARFAITGTVYPSFANGGLTQLIAEMAENGTAMDAGTMAEATPEMSGEAGNMMSPRSTNLAEMIVPDELFDHTIIAVYSVDDIQFLQLPE